jgi:hypothetical protein
MSVQITTAFVNQFHSNVTLALQQMDTRFRGAVRVESINGEYGYFDQIGATAAVLRTVRHGDTQYVDTPHTRRRLPIAFYEWADLIDKEDKVRMLIDPTSAYVQNAAAAMFRAMDTVIVTAFDATAYTGVAGGDSTSFTSGNIVGVTVGDTVTGSAACGLTIGKLRAAAKLLNANEVPKEDRFIAISAKQLDDLLGTTQATSSDYNSVKALVDGSIDTFMGFKFILSERLTVDGSNYREVMCWQKNGLMLGIGNDVEAKVDQLPTKGYATQVYVSMGLGAVRMDEKACVQILCSEA